MDGQIVAAYSLCDDLLRALGHQEDVQCRMTDAEVMTTALVAVLFYRGNFEMARWHLREQGYIPQMLSKSRFNRRLHRVKEQFLTLFSWLGEVWKALNGASHYASTPSPSRRWTTMASGGHDSTKGLSIVAIKPASAATSTG